MKFWLIEAECGTTVGCETSRRKADATAKELGYGLGEYTLICMHVPVTTETVRRLLGGLGGFATWIE